MYGKSVKEKYMTEGVSSSYASTMQSIENKQQALSDWHATLKQIVKKNDNSANNLNLRVKQNSSKEQTSPFLSNSDIAERESAFLTFENSPEDRKNVFLANETMTERTSPFLNVDIKNDNKPFLEPRVDTSDAKSPLELSKTETDTKDEAAAAATATQTTSTPMSDYLILSELRRNPMSSTLSIRDIAEDFGISYQKAIDIFKALNADTNGIAKEFNLPDRNATVSYLV